MMTNNVTLKAYVTQQYMKLTNKQHLNVGLILKMVGSILSDCVSIIIFI